MLEDLSQRDKDLVLLTTYDWDRDCHSLDYRT